LEFNSKRKRMTVILKDEDGQILLFCKGADRYVAMPDIFFSDACISIFSLCLYHQAA
jgi:hypothetical protein